MSEPGQFFDEETGGALRLELKRTGPGRFELLRKFGYQDHRYDEPFIVPKCLCKFDSDLASIPWLVAWLVPPFGPHFPAIMLHDGLVVPKGEPPTHDGPPVARIEADRIMRDAMGQSGTPLVRRWVAWTGAVVATVAVDMKTHQWWWRLLLVVTFGAIMGLGAIATLDLFDAIEWLPWMGDQVWWAELLSGFAAAVVIPLIVSVAWWSLWRAAAIGGVSLAVLLHVTLAIMAIYGGYCVLEKLLSGRTHPT